MVKRAVELMSRFSAMKTSRSNHESAWQDISDYMMPFRGDITTKKSGGGQAGEARVRFHCHDCR